MLLSGHVVQLHSKYLCYAHRLASVALTVARGASFRDGQQVTERLKTSSAAKKKVAVGAQASSDSYINCSPPKTQEISWKGGAQRMQLLEDGEECC